MSAEHIKIVATFTIDDHNRFLSIANEMVEYCRQHEPETLVYDWYVDANQQEGRLVEVYSNTEAFRRHVTGGIFTDLAPKMIKAIQWQSLEAYGELPNEFDRVMKAFPSRHWPKACVAL